jgi:hypothetical protein
MPKTMNNTTERPALKVRNVHFNFANVRKHWMQNSALGTHFVNSMHIVFPEGEKFFIRSVRQFAKDIKDEKLKKDINLFCGQEGIHSREHERFWEIMEDQGLKPDRFAKFMYETAFGKYGLEKTVIKTLNKVKPRLGEKLCLSVTTAAEHFTALFAHGAFSEKNLNDKETDENMKELMQWHAAEEIEHKAVCFDALKEIDDSYALRVGGMLLTTPLLFGYIGIGQLYFWLTDNDAKMKDLPVETYKFIEKTVFGSMGAQLSKHYFEYYKKDFHPNDIDDYYLIEKFFENKSYA